MGYLDILKSSKKEADNTPQEVIRAELSKKFPPDVRKIYGVTILRALATFGQTS